MIDRSLINTERLLDMILDDCAGNINRWWRLVEFVKDYKPRFSQQGEKPTQCSILCGGVFLRDLGRGVFIWDTHYGAASEFYTPEQALLALMKAPVPPHLLPKSLWQE